ncbi:hypothetical protein VTN49DRAFT_420 [Thermomyces lanuginosus]|uniref:uncharacterized protein n=1 Tax=Thermomyces lanuginosus TaxID=5541 RepID=UPI0037427820
MASDATSTLQAESIIGDVLPRDVKLKYNLKVEFPNAKLEKPGQKIDVKDTQPQPTVYVEPVPENEDGCGSYTLLMVDPDLTRRHDTRFGQVRHWLATKCSIGDKGEVIHSKNTTLSPWVGPAPLPVPDVTGKPHPSRYTFIICCDKISTASTKIDPDSLRSEYEGKPGELGKPTQDIIDRMGFNTERFLMKNNLDAIAATFMFVEGSLKSGMNNAALAATAMANKVMGR